jgi:hypothetical protein
MWDTFALALDDGAVSADDGERGIEHLEHETEYIPKSLRKPANFATAIRTFASRLRMAPQGATPGPPRGPQETLYLCRRPST